jgi:hypothetical protein
MVLHQEVYLREATIIRVAAQCDVLVVFRGVAFDGEVAKYEIAAGEIDKAGFMVAPIASFLSRGPLLN